jgi:hypothetical protein
LLRAAVISIIGVFLMLILSSTGGRLGNLLILHSHALAYAAQMKQSVWFPALHAHARSFEGPSKGLVLGNEALNRLHRLVPGKYPEWFLLKLGNQIEKRRISNRIVGTVTASFDEPIVDTPMEDPAFAEKVKRHRLLFLLGFRFRAPNYIQSQRSLLLEYFRPVEAVRSRIDRVEQEARSKGDVLVAAHIRRGDYEHFQGGKYFYPLETYSERMRQIRDLLAPQRVVFVVLAEQRLDPEHFAGLDILPGPGAPVEDMYTIGRCDYSFGVPSTFSRWGAWYGGVPHWIMDHINRVPTLEQFKLHSV